MFIKFGSPIILGVFMGLLDGITSIFSNKSAQGQTEAGAKKAIPFKLATSFRPVRLRARNENSCDLVISIKNMDSEPHLCSVLVELPKQLGFDGVGLHKSKELRIGELAAGQEKEISTAISANNLTPPGNYSIFVSACSHYRDYSHVFNSVRKSTALRVV